MGDTHLRSNLKQHADETLSIEFNECKFVTGYVTTFTSNSVTATTVTAVTGNVTTGHTTTFTSNAVTATSIISKLVRVNATNALGINMLASSALSGTPKVVAMRDYTAPATPVTYYVKLYPTKA